MFDFALVLTVVNSIVLVWIIVILYWAIADLREYINILSQRVDKKISFNDIGASPPKSYVMDVNEAL